MLNRNKAKGRRTKGTYVGIPTEVMKCPKYARLTPRAVKLMMDLATQYRGHNNGDLSIAWSQMEKVGWRSKDQLYKARKELLKAGFIEVTRQGGKHCCTLYALTWYNIDYCKGKLDVRDTTRPSGKWKGCAPNTDHISPPRVPEKKPKPDNWPVCSTNQGLKIKNRAPYSVLLINYTKGGGVYSQHTGLIKGKYRRAAQLVDFATANTKPSCSPADYEHKLGRITLADASNVLHAQLQAA